MLSHIHCQGEGHRVSERATSKLTSNKKVPIHFARMDIVQTQINSCPLTIFTELQGSIDPIDSQSSLIQTFNKHLFKIKKIFQT